jgi:hypothetical protein
MASLGIQSELSWQSAILIFATEQTAMAEGTMRVKRVEENGLKFKRKEGNDQKH